LGQRIPMEFIWSPTREKDLHSQLFINGMIFG
jgi:hypothetical protein